MPISSTNRKAGPFAGDDVSTTFPFTFKAFSDADVEVVVADALGAETVLTLTTDYTVNLNADQETSPGGDVVLNAPLATGTKLVATTSLEELQPVDFTNQGGFYPQVINQALDRLTIFAQQLRVDVDRSAKLPITRTEDADQLLSDVVLVADNMASVQTVGASIGSVNQVAAIDTEVTQVAAVAASVPVVAAVDTEVVTVAGIAADVTTVAGISGNVTAVAANEVNVNAVAAIATEVGQVAAIDTEVAQVAAAIPDIQAAVADLPSLAAKVSKTGDTMTGPLSVPAGASGTQVGRVQEVCPPGLIAFFCMGTAPTGWLKANGANVSRTAYASLFAAIGTTFGVGDGSTTFTLPDMRGEFPRGWDDGRGVDSGRAFGSGQSHAMQAHTHGSLWSNTVQVSGGAGVFIDNKTGAVNTDDLPPRVGAVTGATTATETRPRNIALLACIKF